MKKPNTRHAFSLVELSIVLVILGLLTGGILGGQSLIKAAELRSVSMDHQRYLTAIATFRDKYFTIPGDMSNAQAFWGAAGTCPGNNASPSTTPATCNGDGNGQLRSNAPTSNEPFRFWQHLANAGLIEGNFTGVSNSATATDSAAVFGLNIPRSKVNNAGWHIGWMGDVPISDTTRFEGNYGNIFYFGSIAPGGTATNPILKPEDAWNIDTKMDDGRPATGNLVTWEFDGTACSDLAASGAGSLAASAYLLSGTGTPCRLIFKNVAG
jgi:prepilin-type N-terminal cleavage/methylation domain-containing protein